MTPEQYARKIVDGLDAARRASSMTRPVDEVGLIEAAFSDATAADAKQISYLQSENSILHERLRKLEIALEGETERCAKISEEYGRRDSSSRQSASYAANSIAALIRGREG